jgi:hypothetical protein
LSVTISEPARNRIAPVGAVVARLLELDARHSAP